jgi:hypothetical protein
LPSFATDVSHSCCWEVRNPDKACQLIDTFALRMGVWEATAPNSREPGACTASTHQRDDVGDAVRTISAFSKN